MKTIRQLKRILAKHKRELRDKYHVKQLTAFLPGTFFEHPDDVARFIYALVLGNN